MADKGNPSSYTGRLKDKIKKNEKNINVLEEDLRTLREKLKDHEENCEPKIKELEKEIERLKGENKTLREEIRELKKEIVDLKESNAFLEDKMDSTSKQLKEHDEKLKSLQLSEDELIIRQLCSSVQKNILKIVLHEYFDEIGNKSIEQIHQYINWQIKDKKEQGNAKSRWKKLKKEIKWNNFLIRQLQPVKESGNETAHPSLTDKKIDNAKMNLKEKKKLSVNMMEAVDQLKNIWIQTNSKLPPNGSRESSVEVQRLSGLKYPPTHASKAAEYTLAVWMPRSKAFGPKHE